MFSTPADAASPANPNAATEDIESDERFCARTFDVAPLGMAVIGLDGRWLKANRVLCSLLGYSAAELATKSIWDLAPPDDSAVEQQVIAALAAGRQQAIRYERRLNHQSGRLLWISVNIALVRDGAGNPDYLVAHIQDIGAEREAEEARRVLLRAVEQSPASIIITDPKGAITYVNPRFTQVTGYTAPEVLGKNPRLLKSNVHPAEFYADIWRTIAAGGEWHGEFCNRKKDGTLYWELASISPIHDDAGRLTHYVSVKEDVTERKQTERALRATQERFAALADGTYGVVAELNADARFTFLSPSVEAVLGYSPGELLDRWAFDLIHTDDVDVTQQALARTKATGQGAVNHRVRRKDGQWRHFDTTGRVYRTANGELRILLMARDVTERIELEERYRQAQKLEAVGILAGGVAHDFNNLLTGIRGFTDLSLAVETDPHKKRDLAQVRQLSDRAARLTQQLLAFSRKQSLALVALDLNQLIDETTKMLRRMIGEDIDLVFEPGTALGTVRADPTQLVQVLLNLAVNARDAMPRGGRLAIRTENVVLDDDFARGHVSVQPGNYVRLTIADNGCGMDEVTRQHCFEPFYTTKEQGRGTGLGLATVYGIVKQHGGNIWVESAPNAGTTFEINFPRVDAPVETRLRAEPATDNFTGNETVLLAEDEPVVREIAQRNLEEFGYRVLLADDVASTITLFERHRDEIDLLLTDVVMPMESGPVLYRRLARQRPDLKVVYMTGHADRLLSDHGLVDSTATVVRKPFDALDLLREVRRTLDGGRAAIRVAETGTGVAPPA
jgi:PAS domain S-box-containing protein